MPKKLRKMLRNFQLPLFELQVVFYFAGMLDKSGVDTTPCEQQRQAIAVEDLREMRRKFNAYIMAKVKPSEEEELMKQVQEDVEEGAMAPPREVDWAYLLAHGVARWMPAVAFRANGTKKVRGVDHFSENGVKAITSLRKRSRRRASTT